MRVIIAGCGRVGSQLAVQLAHENHNVVVIDRDPQSFQRLGYPFNGLTIAGVAFDLDVLREAGIEEADAFIALTNYDNTNLMAAEIAASIFGVPRVMARVYNPDKELTYRSMGIDYLSGSALLAVAFHKELTYRSMGIDYLSGSALLAVAFHKQLTWRGSLVHAEKAGGFQVVEVEVPAGSRGCRLHQLRQAGRARTMALMRTEKPLFLERNAPVRPGDRVLLALDVREFSWGELLEALGVPAEGHPREETLGPGGASREERALWRVVLAGCGRVGSQLAEMLSLDGYRVAVIDRDPRAGEKLSKTYQGEFHVGMAFDMEVLEEAGIEEADAFAAVTNFDNANLMAAEVARGIYGVGRVVSRLFNPDKEETYQALDIDFICGTTLLAEEVLKRLLPSRPRVLSRTANNRVLVVEFRCPRRLRGKKVAKLESEEMMRVGLVARGEEVMVASPEMELREGDVVVAALLAPRLKRLHGMVREGMQEESGPRSSRNRVLAGREVT